MAGEEVDGNLENLLSDLESPPPDIRTIWDLRRLLRSSEERLEKLKNTSPSDRQLIQLERAIIRGVSGEIRRLENKTLCPDRTLR